LRQLGGDERIVVCNSIGCLLWLRFATELPAGFEPVDRLLLVSPPDSARIPDAAASFRIDGVEGDAVRASARTPIRLACSDAIPTTRAAHRSTLPRSRPTWTSSRRGSHRSGRGLRALAIARGVVPGAATRLARNFG
jgi:pimeloyl-ACP methyl ester carboxylesterase